MTHTPTKGDHALDSRGVQIEEMTPREQFIQKIEARGYRHEFGRCWSKSLYYDVWVNNKSFLLTGLIEKNGNLQNYQSERCKFDALPDTEFNQLFGEPQ